MKELELSENFIPFREKLITQIEKFENENDCQIVALRNGTFVCFTSIKKSKNMKIKTEWGIGDLVYILYENNVLKGNVGKIQFNILEDKSYKYWLAIKNELNNWVGAVKEYPDYPEFFDSKNVYRTKEDLLKSL